MLGALQGRKNSPESFKPAQFNSKQVLRWPAACRSLQLACLRQDFPPVIACSPHCSAAHAPALVSVPSHPDCSKRRFNNRTGNCLHVHKASRWPKTGLLIHGTPARPNSQASIQQRLCSITHPVKELHQMLTTGLRQAHSQTFRHHQGACKKHAQILQTSWSATHLPLLVTQP